MNTNNQPQVVAILGGQWGDEGKGKIVDWAAQFFNVSARATGGNNAGHTVQVKNEKHIFHLIPSAVTWKKVDCLLGNGMVIDPLILLKEIQVLQEKGYSLDNLYISGRAHVILLYHRMQDSVLEQQKGDKKIGTTGRGIGSSYADKMHRSGIRINDLLDKEVLSQKITHHLWEKFGVFKHLHEQEEEQILINLQKSLPEGSYFDEYRALLSNLKNFDFKEIINILVEVYWRAGKKLKPYITDTTLKINQALSERKKILLEGAQGILLDIDHGTYPFVTSSNSSLGGLKTGLGIAQVDEVYSVLKAYTTRVGSGPFITELETELGDEVRRKGQEYGATTGRPRRCGWHDAVLTRHTARVNGRKVIITKLDILTGLDKLKICNSYKYIGPTKIFNGEVYFSGKIVREFPADSPLLEKCVPHEWVEMESWEENISLAKEFKELPKAARDYLQKIEELGGVEVCAVGIGPERDQILIVPGKWPFSSGVVSSPTKVKEEPIANGQYHAIIYDLDNTLIATNDFVFNLIKKTALKVCLEIPFNIPADEQIKAVLKKNLPFEDIFLELFPDPANYSGQEKMWKIILEKYRENAKIIPYSAVAPGPEIVLKFKQLGLVQGIVTNRIRMAQERLEQAEYSAFDFLLAPEKEEERKPNPHAFSEALKKLQEKGIAKNQVLSVGDHPEDYLASREAGISFVAVLTGLTTKEEFLELGLPEERIINNLGELKKIINKKEN